MAVYAAHLTRARGEAPSVFQVAAERALASEVKPALRRLVEYVASGHDGLQWLERWFDEIYLLLDVALQHYYLKHYAASFSESFYGLMRVSVAAAAGGGGAAGAGGDEWGGARLGARMERLSLALLAVAPYLRDRAAPALQRWRQRMDDRLLGKDKWDWARSPRWRWADLLAGHVGFPELAPLLLRAAQYAAFGVQLLAYCAALAPAAALPPPPPPPPPPPQVVLYTETSVTHN